MPVSLLYNVHPADLASQYNDANFQSRCATEISDYIDRCASVPVIRVYMLM